MRLILIFLSALLAGGFYFLCGWYPDVSWLQLPAVGLGLPVLAVSLALFMAIVRMHPGRDDPALVFWAVIAFIGCLFVLPLIVAREQQAGLDQQRDRDIHDLRDALRLQALERQRQQEALLADRRERAKSDRFVQYEGRIPADMLDKLRQLDRDMLQSVDQQAEAYRVALETNPTLGPEAWMRFRTIDQLESELASHKALYERARAFTQFVESFEESYNSAIRKLNLQPPADRIAIAEMERVLQDWDRTQLYELRRLDVRLLAEAIRALSILSAEWGEWSYLPREKRVAFSNPSQEAAFLEAVLMASAIVEEVKRIEEALSDPGSPD